jgi:hypothetical protein
MLTENNPNMRMVLARNPNFHGETYPAEGMPRTRRRAAGRRRQAACRSWSGPSTAWRRRASRTGTSSCRASTTAPASAPTPSTRRCSSTPRRGRAHRRHAREGHRAGHRGQYLDLVHGLQHGRPLLGGDSERARLLRQAISIAVDFGEYISIFANGRGVEGQGPIPPASSATATARRASTLRVRLGNGRRSAQGHRSGQALLAQAGYRDGRDPQTGRPLSIYYEAMDAGPDGKARLNWMRKQFAKLGIELVVRATDYNRFQEKMREGTGQVFMWGWNADYPDPENFFFLLYGPNKQDRRRRERGQLQNPEFDALFEQMKNMDDGPERQAGHRPHDRDRAHDAPWSFGFYPKSFSLHHQWLGNVKPNLMANNTLKYRSLEPELRERLRAQWNPPVLWPIGAALLIWRVGALPAIVIARVASGACPVSAYIIRRLLYAIPILIGVNLITFVLFFVVNSPDDMARMQLGDKRVTAGGHRRLEGRARLRPAAALQRRRNRPGQAHRHHLFPEVRQAVRVRLRLVGQRSRHRLRHLPAHVAEPGHRAAGAAVGLTINISYALMIIFFRATYIDFGSVVLLVAMMSISGLFYIIGGQFLIGKLFHLVPISGYDTGLEAAKFLVCRSSSASSAASAPAPGCIGPSSWKRSIATMSAPPAPRGCVSAVVLFRHVLRNALIPILTGVVAVLPLLFMGALITESFFGVPGLGSYTIDAINRQDFSIVRAMVFLGSVLYILGLILTDISYTMVDPRVRLS